LQRQLHPVRHPDVADHRARSSDRERSVHRLAGADALERGANADSVGQVHDGLGCLFAPLLDDVGGAEFARELLPGGVAAHDDDAIRPEALGSDHPAEPDRAIGDDGDDDPERRGRPSAWGSPQTGVGSPAARLGLMFWLC
jgi:hypothetical protein